MSAQVKRQMLALTGNETIALAMKQIHPDVVAAYPITPSTTVMEKFAEYVANGEVQTELVTVESEHSAMSACIGAATCGVRVMTATSSQGFALMWEMLYVAASLRLPLVMAVVNRALNSNLNIHCDHSDSMGGRDAGWIQLYSEDAQEVYDNLIQAVRIAEHPDVFLPVMVMSDGFYVSHSVFNVTPLSDEEVREFIGTQPRSPYNFLDISNPITVGPVDLPDYYMEHKRLQAEAYYHAKRVVKEIGEEFGKRFGRSYGYFETYGLEDAELVIVIAGTAAGTTRYVVEQLRREGRKVGMLKMRVFRPFPQEEICAALQNAKAVAVLDRSDSFGAFAGPMYTEIRSALYEASSKPKLINRIYGLGGRDLRLSMHMRFFHNLRHCWKVVAMLNATIIWA